MNSSCWTPLDPVRRVTLAAALLSLALLPLADAVSQSRPKPAPLPQPSQAELGVPVYPGATYDGRNSAGMSMSDHYMWIFMSTDPVDKVAAFYKAKTGRVPANLEGAFLFTLKRGSSEYFPDHGVMVEPNKMFAPPAVTAITVIKLKESSKTSSD
jgi:hypothetical protein